MSKWDELKRLAEAATPGPWEGEHEVYEVNGKAEMICKYASSEDSLFIGAANPKTILELIEENERLAIALLEIAGRVLGGGREERERWLEAFRERDQLRDEVEALRKDAERYLWLRDKCPSLESMEVHWLFDDFDQVIDDILRKSEKGND